ncbi:MAG TPA: FUSC family membrane protein, partial [Chitinophaga sp.]
MQIEQTLREIKRFIFSYHFSNGLRMTIGVVLPSVLFYYLGHLDIGIGLSTGALCTGISDVPGTAIHKRNGLLISTALNTLVALGTGLVMPYFFLTIPWILLVCFFCGMLLVYGNRGGNIGIGGLLVMVLVIGEPTTSIPESLSFAGLVLGGCLWYNFLALLLWQVRPYLNVQQALGSCLIETAYYLDLRANFYQPGVNITENYNAVLAQQVKVNEQTEAVRELLLKRRADQQGTTSINKSLVMIFLEAVDLQEQVMTSHIDYEELHRLFPDDSLLGPFRHLIYLFSEELKNIGIAVSAGLRSKPHHNLPYEIEKVKKLLADYRSTLTSFQERTELLS